MNSPERDMLSRQMGEASALPPDDPQRLDVERRVAAAGSWAQQQWADLHRESECYRRQLLNMSIPAGLETRLIGLPDRQSRLDPSDIVDSAEANRPQELSRKGVHDHWRFWVAMAAVLLVGVVLVRHRMHADRLQTVALLAINNHLNHLDDQHLSVTTSDAARLERALTGQVPFDVVVPPLGRGYHLRGGRKCQLGTHPVALTMWNGPDGTYSLFQFRCDDLGLSPDMSRTAVRAAGPAAADEFNDALIWTGQTFGYVLVTDRRGG